MAVKKIRGIASQYARTELMIKEEEAFEKAIIEKHKI